VRDPYEAEQRRIRRMVEFIAGLDEVLAPLRTVPPLANTHRAPGRKKGSGVDVLVRHLRDAEGVPDYHEVYKILQASDDPRINDVIDGWGPAFRERIRDAYARGGPVHVEACDYCANGLPRSLAEALALVKPR
jgi:hypothetical protein